MSPAAKQFLAFAQYVINHKDFDVIFKELTDSSKEAWQALREAGESANVAGQALCLAYVARKRDIQLTPFPQEEVHQQQVAVAVGVCIALHMQGLIPAAARDEATPGVLVVPIPTAEVRAHVDAKLASDSALMGVNSVVRGTDIVRMPPPDAMAVKVATLGATTKLLNETGWHVDPPGPMDPDDPSRPE